jgi:hypothetical protein
LFNYEFVEHIIRLIEGGAAPSNQTVGSLLRTPWSAMENDLIIALFGFDDLPIELLNLYL